MHTPQDTLFMHHKFQILNEIVGVILNKIDSEELDMDEAKSVAQYVLQESEKSNSSEDLQNFLNQLALKWNMFESIRSAESEKVVLQAKAGAEDAETTAKLDEVRKQLSSFINNSDQSK